MRDYWTLYYYLIGKLSLEETKKELEDICWITDDQFVTYYGFYDRIEKITEYIGMILYSQEESRKEISHRIKTFLLTIESNEVFVTLLQKLLKSELIKNNLHHHDLFKRLKQIA
jgi:hypothetical protein